MLPFLTFFVRKFSEFLTYNFIAVKNTVELVNSKDESILKVCFDSPLSSASWIADFRKAKDEIESINKFQEGELAGDTSD